MQKRNVAKSRIVERSEALGDSRTPAGGADRMTKGNSGAPKAGQASAPGVPEKSKKRVEFKFLSKSRQRHKQMRIAEAMREAGCDEPAVARGYVRVVQKLLGGKEGNASDKLLVELLKEISRTLEPQGAAGGGAAGTSDLPTVVQLIHDVPRPVRERADAADSGFFEFQEPQ
jgi:hypothetical protein